MKKYAQVFMLDGVGINFEKFKAVFPEGKLEDSDDFIILYIAEFIPRKDHEFFIKNIPDLKRQIPSMKVIMPGRNGALYQLNNNADFVEKIVVFYKNPDLRAEMRKNKK